MGNLPSFFKSPRILSSLRHRNYRLFFLGQMVSLVGTWMHSVAQGWLVVRLTGSAYYLGATAAAGALAILIFSIPAGVVGDLFSKRAILIATQVGASVVALTLAYLTFSEQVTPGQIILCSFLIGVTTAFESPVRQAFMFEITDASDLLNAIALNSTVFHLARFIGPALAGLLVARFGEAPVFLLNAGSFAAIVLSLLFMRIQSETPHQHERASLRKAITYVRQTKQVKDLLLLSASLSFFGLSYLPLLPLFVRNELYSDARGLGFLMSASGVGAVIAALSLAQWSHSIDRERFAKFTALLFPFTLIFFAQSETFPTAMLLAIILGWSGVGCFVVINGLIQLLVPGNIRARVLSLFTLSVLGFGPVGGMVIGALIEVTDQLRLFITLSAVIALFTSWHFGRGLSKSLELRG